MADSSNDTVVLALVLRYLKDSGFNEAYNSLCTESGLNLEQIASSPPTVDISLPELITGYEDLYQAKHGRKSSLRNEVYLDTRTDVESSSATAATSRRPEMLKSVLRQSGMTGTTKFIGTTDTLNQDAFFRVLCDNPTMEPSELFRIALPLACARRLRPSQLTLTKTQEHVLYGLVGCEDVVWRVSAVTQQSRDILEHDYGVDKRTLQLFFKNRYPNRKIRKRKMMGSGRSVHELEEYRNSDAFVPILPATSSEKSKVSSLFEMLRELDPGGIPVNPALISLDGGGGGGVQEQRTTVIKSDPDSD
eukprot:g6032.t1